MDNDVRCQGCGVFSPSNAQHCIGCGTALAASCDQASSPPMTPRTCPDCFAIIEPDRHNCPNCGRRCCFEESSRPIADTHPTYQAPRTHTRSSSFGAADVAEIVIGLIELLLDLLSFL
jgi:RNA polymerase subunit RPABC4/transcription elongation factor Spt4